MKLLWTDTAKADLQGIYDYIADDSIYYANNFIDALISKTAKLTDFPCAGRVVPEIGDETVREIIYRSYRIMYKVTPDIVYITQISHSAQEFNQH